MTTELTIRRNQRDKRIRKKTNKKIISAGVFQWWCDNILVNPFELLNYFKNADYVITDTFHGCVMSIKFNKNFCVFIRESNKNKISDLLNDFSINFKQVSHCGELSIALSKKIDYNIINKKIKEEQDLAMLYLNDNLKI